MTEIITKEENIASLIYLVRGQKVMIDSDLAALYGVETRVLNQAVKRNNTRFPEDFMFQLSDDEYENLRSQSVISIKYNKSRRYLPYVFTEHGTVMLASVLNSDAAVKASIHVVRTFVKLREFLTANKDLAVKMHELERKTQEKFSEQDGQIGLIFQAIEQLTQPDQEPREQIGFKSGK